MSSPDRRRLPRGPEFGTHFTLRALRWVYVYVTLFALLVTGPAVLDWFGADGGSPAEAAASARLGALARTIVAPLCVVALAVSVHVGAVVGRAKRFVDDLDVPFRSLRDRIAHQTRLARRAGQLARELTDRVDDDADLPRDLSAQAHDVRDAVEQIAARPAARTLDLRAGERTPAPESQVAALLG